MVLSQYSLPTAGLWNESFIYLNLDVSLSHFHRVILALMRITKMKKI